MTELVISNSEIATWDRCHRKWYLQYYLGLVPSDEPVTSSRLLGVRIHTALEGYYGYDLDPLAVLGLLYQVLESEKPEAAAELQAEHELARIMVSGYLEWVAETGADADLEVIAVERDVQVPLGVSHHGFDIVLRCRLDQMVRQLSDGRAGFLDHKTAASFERHDVLVLDPQMRFYCWVQQLEHSGGPAPLGGFVNTLRRVRRTSKAKPPFYQRDQFWYPPQMIGSTAQRSVAICQDIAAARGSLDWISQQTGPLVGELLDTFQRGRLYPTPIIGNCDWSCPFVTLCPMMDDGSDWTGAALRSGRWTQADPYAYYRDDPLRVIRQALAGT